MNKKSSVWIAVCLVLAVVMVRIIGAETGQYNFAPVAALGLFSGAVMQNKRDSFILAVAAQLIADLYFQFFTNIPGFYGLSQFFTYAGIIGATVLGFTIKNIKVIPVVLGGIGAAVIFFIVSNFGYFVQGFNGYTVNGLVKTYADAVPFFRNSVIGNVAGSVVLFAAYYLATRNVTALKKAQA